MHEQLEALLLGGHPFFYGIVFFGLLLCGLGFPMSADLILLTCGYLAYLKRAELGVLIPVAMGGILLSDVLMFFVGSGFGYRLLQVWPLSKVLNRERIAAAERNFKRSGYRYVFTARFLPGLRTVVFFTAGVLKLRFGRFLLFDFLGASITVPGTLIAVVLLAGNVPLVLDFLKRFQTVALMGVAMVVSYTAFRAYSRRSKS
jgi:membrane protein DedA with SNARE-associated domain